MSHDKPSISTIIATYNRPKLLTRTLDCLARQTQAPAEVLIVDDGSGADTRDAVRNWERRVRPDFQVSYLWQENQGPATARNKGTEACAGDLIHFLDDDDLLCPGALEQLAGALDTERPAIAMASYQYWEQGNPMGGIIRPRTMASRDILRSMIQGTWFVPIHGYLFTRPAIARMGPWNPALTSQEDDELLLRAALAGIPFIPAPAAHVYYCQHGGVRRATPGKPGETVSQGMEKRMYADIAIRESVFEALSEREDPESFRMAFALWHMRLRKRYSCLLSRLHPNNELLNWLNMPDMAGDTAMNHATASGTELDELDDMPGLH